MTSIHCPLVPWSESVPERIVAVGAVTLKFVAIVAVQGAEAGAAPCPQSPVMYCKVILAFPAHDLVLGSFLWVAVVLGADGRCKLAVVAVGVDLFRGCEPYH